MKVTAINRVPSQSKQNTLATGGFSQLTTGDKHFVSEESTAAKVEADLLGTFDYLIKL